MSDDIPACLAMLSPQTRAPESVERLKRLVKDYIVPRPDVENVA
jgi:hypothetical protein